MTYSIIDRKANDFNRTSGFTVIVTVATLGSLRIYTSSTSSMTFVTRLLFVPHLHCLCLYLHWHPCLLCLGHPLCLRLPSSLYLRLLPVPRLIRLWLVCCLCLILFVDIYVCIYVSCIWIVCSIYVFHDLLCLHLLSLPRSLPLHLL